MMTSDNMIAIYDFELFPYALGDVLTWNVQTAIRAEQANKMYIDIYICMDEKHPASVYQRDLVNKENYQLFFNELFNAFTTNPRLGNIYIFHRREMLITELEQIANNADDINLETITDYLDMLQCKLNDGSTDKLFHVIRNKLRSYALVRKAVNYFVPSSVKKTLTADLPNRNKLNDYFTKYILSHKAINQFAAAKSYIPFLKPVPGCIPDVDELIEKRLKDMQIVSFHLRLRRLDVGYGGNDSYARDSDFLEWYDFLNEASKKHPQVIFVALGRIQEKPLDIIRLPNVMSLRLFGMGLGHELTLMLKSHLFIGTSSGFATLANFSALPYFITRMNAGYSCYAYDIPEGTKKLPFAKENQQLIYEQETSDLLMRLLEQGLGIPRDGSASKLKQDNKKQVDKLINIENWLKLRSKPANTSSTTRRFYTTDQYDHEETAYLLLPHLEQIRKTYFAHNTKLCMELLLRIEKNFPILCYKIPAFLLLRGLLAAEQDDTASMQNCLQCIETIESDNGSIQLLKSFLTMKLHNKFNRLIELHPLKCHIQGLMFDNGLSGG